VTITNLINEIKVLNRYKSTYFAVIWPKYFFTICRFH